MLNTLSGIMFHALTNRVKSLLGLLYPPTPSTHATNTTFLPSTYPNIPSITIVQRPNSPLPPSSTPPATGFTKITTWTSILTTMLNHYLPHTPRIIKAAAKRTPWLRARASESATTTTDGKRRNPVVGALNGRYVYSFQDTDVDSCNRHRCFRDVDHLDPRIHDDDEKGCNDDNKQRQKKTWLADINDRTMLFIAPLPSDASTTRSSTDRGEMGAWSQVQEEEFDEFEEFERNVLGVVRDERGSDKEKGWSQWLSQWIPVFGGWKIPDEETEEEDITGFSDDLEDRSQSEGWEWVSGVEESLFPQETNNDPENEWEFMPAPNQILNNGLSAFVNNSNIIWGPCAPRIVGTFTKWAESWDWRKESETLVGEESWEADSDLENMEFMDFDDNDHSLDGGITDAISLSSFLGYEKVEHNNIGGVRRLRDLISLPDPDDLPFALPSKNIDTENLDSDFDTMDETLIDSIELTFPFALSATSPTSITFTPPPSTAASEISLLPDRELAAKNLSIALSPGILQELATLDTSFHLPPLQTPQTPTTEPHAFHFPLSPPTTPQHATSRLQTFDHVPISNPPPSPASPASSCPGDDFDTLSDLLSLPPLAVSPTIPLTPTQKKTSNLPPTPITGSRTHVCAFPSLADCTNAEETEYDDVGDWRELRAMVNSGGDEERRKVEGIWGRRGRKGRRWAGWDFRGRGMVEGRC